MELSVKKKFDLYPEDISILLREIREHILLTANVYSLGEIEETLKWGEPSYNIKGGCAVKFDWKSKQPNQYCIYFNCKISLIEKFKALYGDTFKYIGKRAIVFQNNDIIPPIALRHCISLSLRYQKLKNCPCWGPKQKNNYSNKYAASLNLK